MLEAPEAVRTRADQGGAPASGTDRYSVRQRDRRPVGAVGLDELGSRGGRSELLAKRVRSGWKAQSDSHMARTVPAYARPDHDLIQTGSRPHHDLDHHRTEAAAMLLNGFDHVAVLTEDSERCTSFYIEVFGATVVPEVPGSPRARGRGCR